MAIIDTRRMSREERMAAAEESAKRQAVERREQARAHAERNAAALKAQQEWTALSPDERAERRRQEQAEKMARHAAANAAAEAKAAPGPSENKMLLPAVENKAPPKTKPIAAVGPLATFTAPAVPKPDATDAAVALAKKHRINLAKVKGTGAGGRIIMADVEAKIP